jgi:hypothetical protein
VSNSKDDKEHKEVLMKAAEFNKMVEFKREAARSHMPVKK